MTPPWPVAAFIPWSMVVPCTAVRDWGWAYGIDRSTQVYRSTQDEDVHACICPYIQYVYLYV